MASVESGKVPVLQTASAAWRFAMDNVVRLLPAAAILGVGITVLELLVASAPGVGAVFTPGGAAYMAVDFAAGLLVRALFAGVIFRLMMRQDFSRPTGLRFGADEVRILGAQLGAALGYIPLVILIMLLPAMLVSHSVIPDLAKAQTLLSDPEIFTEAIVTALGSTGAGFLMLGLLALVAGVLFVLLRLCLVQAASFAERRIVVFQTWRWTHGNLWHVAAAHIVAYVPAMLAAALVIGLLAGLIAPEDANPDAATVIGVRTITNVLAVIAEIPPIALMGLLYRGLRPTGFQAR
jgi:hypothetical protein